MRIYTQLMVLLLFGCNQSPDNKTRDPLKKFTEKLNNIYSHFYTDSIFTRIITIETKDSLFVDVIFFDSLVHPGWGYLFAEDIMYRICNEQSLVIDKVKADVVFSTKQDNSRNYFYSVECYIEKCGSILNKLDKDSLYRQFHDYVVFETMPHDGIVLDYVLSKHRFEVNQELEKNDIIEIVLKTMNVNHNYSDSKLDSLLRVFDVLLQDSIVQSKPRLIKHLEFFKSISGKS